MDLLTVALGCTVSALAGAAVLRWMKFQTSPGPTQRTVVGPSDRALTERVENLERSFPAWRIEMENLVEQCAEVLDTAERKRKRAAASASRAAAISEVEAQPELPVDPRERRLVELRAVRQRMGGR